MPAKFYLAELSKTRDNLDLIALPPLGPPTESAYLRLISKRLLRKSLKSALWRPHLAQHQRPVDKMHPRASGSDRAETTEKFKFQFQDFAPEFFCSTILCKRLKGRSTIPSSSRCPTVLRRYSVLAPPRPCPCRICCSAFSSGSFPAYCT